MGGGSLVVLQAFRSKAIDAIEAAEEQASVAGDFARGGPEVVAMQPVIHRIGLDDLFAVRIEFYQAQVRTQPQQAVWVLDHVLHDSPLKPLRLAEALEPTRFGVQPVEPPVGSRPDASFAILKDVIDGVRADGGGVCGVVLVMGESSGALVELFQPTAPRCNPHDVGVFAFGNEADRGDGREAVRIVGIVLVGLALGGAQVETVERHVPAYRPHHVVVLVVLDQPIERCVVGQMADDLAGVAVRIPPSR